MSETGFVDFPDCLARDCAAFENFSPEAIAGDAEHVEDAHVAEPIAPVGRRGNFVHPEIPLHVEQRREEEKVEAENAEQADGIVEIEAAFEPFDRVGAHQDAANRNGNDEPVREAIGHHRKCAGGDDYCERGKERRAEAIFVRCRGLIGRGRNCACCLKVAELMWRWRLGETSLRHRDKCAKEKRDTEPGRSGYFSGPALRRRSIGAAD